eukprot:TRINITY_DN2338_c0_g1_i1.p1 TRINITY_DN2338_c0_g1~~TRINITY_DN2338_c0_g1_i1.p1  ORF type:complete len:405 (+),score=46.75 TRINITY_DN2338_c0_g1_i1:87-1301(+)
MSRPAPPKPWETVGRDPSTLHSSARSLKPWEQEASQASTRVVTNPNVADLSGPAIPARDGLPSWDSGNSFNSMYNRRSYYDSPYTYGSYGGYNSFGNYGSSFSSRSPYSGRYGSDFGGFGSNHYGYNNSFNGGYGSYDVNRMGFNSLHIENQSSTFQGVVRNGMGWLHEVEKVSSGFSKFSWLLESNFQALHGSFTSLIRLIEGIGILIRELGGLASGFTIFKLLKMFIARLRNLFHRLLGKKPLEQSTVFNDPDMVKNFNQFSKQPQHSTWANIICTLGVIFIGGPIIVNIIEKLIRIVLRKKNSTIAANDNPLRVRAIYNYKAQTQQDLTFVVGDIITVVDKPSPDWWYGALENQPGQYGVFPVNRITPLQQPEGNAVPPLTSVEVKDSFAVYNNQPRGHQF